MNKRELIEAIKILEKHGIVSYDEAAVIEVMINENNSLPNVEASRVSENEQAREVCAKCTKPVENGYPCHLCDNFKKFHQTG